MNPWSASLLVVCGWCAEIAAVRAQHAGDILVGRTTDLALSATGVPAQTLFLPPVASGPFLGWSSTVLGFDAVVSTNANGSLGPLTSGANVHLEAVSIDPGLSLRSFTTPGFSVNTAWGLNDAGIVVGVVWPGFFDIPSGLVYDTAPGTHLVWNYPGAVQTTLYGINCRGDIVGEFKPNLTSANIPFVRWADGSTQVLDLPGIAGASVYDISDDRVLVGRYKDSSNKNRSFYATPTAKLEVVPATSGLVLRVVGLAGAAYRLESSPDLMTWSAWTNLVVQDPPAGLLLSLPERGVEFLRAVRTNP